MDGSVMAAGRIERPCARPGCDCTVTFSARTRKQPLYCGRACSVAVLAERRRQNPQAYLSTAVLSEEEVRMIRASQEPAKQIARRIGVSPTAVEQARSRKTWRHIL